ncbi:hypothetical protein KC19_10G066000 [Ceratodon purpureus]|uniref:Uncharacterized protein n=1 Tax=Ceratodon purpureus TaxID=3225 RepID=A0A8T0GK72_CERPU|nr:hypothetical protein KC19_10G066000 [Ceratodon purpureus]KAG0558937.1 hypothetical protein KC19_10G066000 [Ceratodon purpureus]
MAPRTAFLLLALVGAVLCLHCVVAEKSLNNAEVGSGVTYESTLDEGQVSGFDRVEEDDDIDTSGEVDVADVDAEEDDTSVPAHPLARILHERGSKRCWSKKHCKKHFKKAGCCRKKCVNLACDNKNCGKCGRSCKVKKGYGCRAGKCRKIKKQSHSSRCGAHKKCKKGASCCKGKCVNLKSNKGHCGKCGKGCRSGSVCCKGKCVNMKHDSRNCGKCGRSCGYGKKCCNGCCKNVFGSDKHNCGGCGKKCAGGSKCKFGMCGYA